MAYLRPSVVGGREPAADPPSGGTARRVSRRLTPANHRRAKVRHTGGCGRPVNGVGVATADPTWPRSGTFAGAGDSIQRALLRILPYLSSCICVWTSPLA